MTKHVLNSISIHSITIALVATLALSWPASATTIEVPSEASSIQLGLALAVPGDTVRVACGTYYEHT